MAAAKGRIPLLLSGLLFSIGVGLLTYGIAYLSLRSRYLGSPQDEIPSSFSPSFASYLKKYDELMFLSLSFAFGVGFMTLSIVSFLIIERTKRAEGEKYPTPEV